MTDIWHELSHFESRDLVADLFERAHGREPNAMKSYAIVAAIAQARRYFESAAESDELVRPLLLYYGVISLSRSLILFRVPHMGEEALRPAHGLTADEWSGTLARAAPSLEARIRRLPQLRVRTGAGTFAELATATMNVDRAPVTNDAGGPVAQSTTHGASTYPPAFGFTLRDALARVPDLSTTFYRTFGERGLCLPARLNWHPDVRRVTINILSGVGGLITEQEMRKRMNLPPWLVVSEGRTGPVTRRDMRSFTIENLSDFDIQALPTATVDGDHNTFVVTYPPDATKFSTLSALFAVSYVTSMLVRYHPSIWFGLVSRMKGDRLLPILREATDVIQSRVPELVLSDLRAAVELGDEQRRTTA